MHCWAFANKTQNKKTQTASDETYRWWCKYISEISIMTIITHYDMSKSQSKSTPPNIHIKCVVGRGSFVPPNYALQRLWCWFAVAWLRTCVPLLIPFVKLNPSLKEILGRGQSNTSIDQPHSANDYYLSDSGLTGFKGFMVIQNKYSQPKPTKMSVNKQWTQSNWIYPIKRISATANKQNENSFILSLVFEVNYQWSNVLQLFKFNE